MEYSRLADCYASLESTQSTLEKASILAELFQDASGEELELLGHLVMGRPFPAWNDAEVGIGDKLMVKAIARATGESADAVEDTWRDTGDLGNAVEQFVEGKKQQTLEDKELTPELVADNLETMAATEGEGSEEKKIARIAELIGFASPREAKYIVRTVLGQMRVGVGEGIVRNAIIEAFFGRIVDVKEFTERLEDEGRVVAISTAVEEQATGYGLYDTFEEQNDVTFVDTAELELAELWRGEGYDLVVVEDARPWKERLEHVVQHAYDMCTDLGRVARTAKEDGVEGLKQIDMELFRPVKVMLAQKAESMEDGFDTVGDENGEAVLEYKYDGMRVQVHKNGDDVRVFTRRLEDVTKQFPDIVQAVKEHINAEECIIEGEAVAYDPDDGSMVPFQELSRRIKRKYQIQEMVEKIPVTVYLFDIIRLEGETLLDDPLTERWDRLTGIVDTAEQAIEPADHLVTSDMEEARAFYQEALQAGQEGIMLKSLYERYKPGSRVGYMVKLKPVMETLDLVIVAADWGEGRRSDWLGSYLLACRDEETGAFKTVGKMATGFTDEQLQQMTSRLEDHITTEKGRHVEIDPSVVVEVAYEEIQKSPQYESGYALRFPRLVQVREDMAPDDANEVGKVENLYEQQEG